MPRFKNIREEVQEMVERLYELHDMTDPRKGNKSEVGKLERAQRAIAIWWYIYARLMQWAQSHIIGYEMTRLSSSCQDILEARRGCPLTEDSHELEVLGSLYAMNVPGYMTLEQIEDSDRDELSEELERRKVELDDATLRRIIVRLLLSTSADSSVWRFPLSHALTALNYGEQDQFFKPSKSRRRGQSYRLDWARANAVAYVYYLLGKGMKKHVAIAKVADGIAASSETIRDWEKKLKTDDWFSFTWESARLAGYVEENPDDQPDGLFDIHYYGTTSSLELARSIITRRELSLAKIKEDLRKYHK